MKRIFKRTLSSVLLVCMLSSVAPCSFAATHDYLVNIMFDDAVTNDASEFVDVSGSQSARVVIDGTKNKAFTFETGYVDNEVTVFVPEYEANNEYVVQFDLKSLGKSTEADIKFIAKNGIEVDMFDIDEAGMLRASDDGKEVGIIGDRYRTVSVAFNTDLSYYSVYLDGRETIHRKNMPLTVSELTKIKLSTVAGGDASSAVFLDNVRVYHGTACILKTAECKFNEESTEYTPVDESQGLNKVYYKNELQTASSFTMTNMAKTNEFKHIIEGENGFLRFIKKSTDDIFFDVTLGNTSKRVVIEADVRYTKKMPVLIPIIRDTVTTNEVQQAGLFSFRDGMVTMSGASGKIKKNVWNKVSTAIDFSKHTFDVYVNGTKIASDKGFPEKMEQLSLVRFYVGGGTPFGEIDVDNIAVYAGSEPRDIQNEEVSANSIFDGDDAGEKFLKGKKALQTYSNVLFDSKTKKRIDGECINIGDESLVPKTAFEEFFGRKVTLSGDSISIDDGTSMTVNSTVMSVNGANIQIPCAPRVEDGILYLPANAYGENVIGAKGFVNDSHGMLVCASGIEAEDTRYKAANQYLFFERKTADELKTEFLEKNDGGNVHPRLMLTEESVSKLRREIQTDKYKKQWFEKVKNSADSILNENVESYKISNGRLLDVANSMLARMVALGFAYQMTGDAKYAKRGIEELNAVSNFPDWHPTHYLDTGTMATAVAIGYDWLYSYMTPTEREFIATKAQEHGLQSAKKAYYGLADFGTFWVDTNTNWGVIVNGGIANLALATAEYNTDETMEVLRNALRAIENTWYYVAPDGAWHEGPGYWSYLLQHLGYFISSYETSMGEYFGKDFRGLSTYGLFQAYFQGPDGWSNNFHDAWPSNVQSDVQFLLSEIYDDDELALYRRDQMEKYNVAPSATDIIWYNSELSARVGSINLPKEAYYRETEFAAMRENWDNDDSAWVSYHGGYANNAHDHIDGGTFVYNIGGTRWAVDIGSEPLSYVATDLDPSRIAGYGPYFFYRRKGEGHNIAVINPDDNLEQIQNAFVKVEEPKSGANGAFGTIDLSAAYAANATNYIRGFKLSDSRRTLTIRDEIELIGESEIRWFMHTEGDIRIIDNNTALIYQDGKALKIQVASNGEATLSAMNAEPLPTSPQFKQTPNEGVTKIDYKVKSAGKTQITVKLSLVGEIGSETGVDETPISEWNTDTISVGRAYAYSVGRADDIKLDGKTITGFDKNKFNYSYTKNKDGNLPTVEAFASNGKATVEYYKRFDGSDAAVIEVKGNDGLTTYYNVVFKEFSLDSIDVYNTYGLTAVGASSEQVEPENEIFNYKENSVDGSLDTRWSAEGKNEWIVYDLGDVKKVDAVAVAYWMGNQRQFSFDVLISNDNKRYSKVMSVTTAGDSENPVVYQPDSTINARYIKLVCHGSNVNEWNNILEFMALSLK